MAYKRGLRCDTDVLIMINDTYDYVGNDVSTEELVWNPAVANLTLLALGSSAPEIMMSCIEIAASEGYFGVIGAPTVVGSAGVCVCVCVRACAAA